MTTAQAFKAFDAGERGPSHFGQEQCKKGDISTQKGDSCRMFVFFLPYDTLIRSLPSDSKVRQYRHFSTCGSRQTLAISSVLGGKGIQTAELISSLIDDSVGNNRTTTIWRISSLLLRITSNQKLARPPHIKQEIPSKSSFFNHRSTSLFSDQLTLSSTFF